jgi:gliding motility-associated-like protein
MKKHRLLIGLFFLLALPLMATHNRAGEITLEQIDDYTYQIKITTFTYTLSQADRSQLEVQWGDNTFSSAPRVEIIRLPNFYQKNTYVIQHTYPGPGTYKIVVQDPNRNLGVKNIPNSVNVVFSIATTITINPLLGKNSTPVLLNPPIDRAALNQVFIHNPAAYDPDGDSISYKLTVCTEEDGKPIEGYEYPLASDTLFIDPITGDLTWITPEQVGIYNIAIDIEEWRSGVKIGNIVRDMQIEVYTTDNNAPSIDSLPDYCLTAGDELNFKVIGRDIDNDSLLLSATGGPLVVDTDPASFSVDFASRTLGYCEGTFNWSTSCVHARGQVYTVVFKAQDNNAETPLVDLKNVNIKITGKAPDPPNLIPSSNSITLVYRQDECAVVQGYNIYRKNGPAGYVPDPCFGGVPSSSGYVRVGSAKERSDTIFVDEGGGSGLEQGIEYCYMITSIYPDGSESFPSAEVCTPLIAGKPSMLEVSVTNDSPSGDITLKWARPEALDTIPGPYRYIIQRSPDLFGGNFTDSYIKDTSDPEDTVFVDQDANTLAPPYSYNVALYAEGAGDYYLVDSGEVASSFYPELVGKDNLIEITMVKNVPWINYDYTIYRENTATGTFDSIGFTTRPFFIDTGLKNFQDYCYRIKSTGWRSIEGQIFENTNFSHINCTQPYDSIPPCVPMLTGQSNCDSLYNELRWRFADESCYEDVESYKMYFSPTNFQDPEPLAGFVGNRTDSVYRDYRVDESLTGCYYITAVDSFGNESGKSVPLCLDECSNYVLPNVFSPNNDKTNDLYIPLKTAYVEKVDFQVFNRWGMLVFSTDDPNINWNGKINGTGPLVSPGVYYYICEVFEPRLGGLDSYTLTGFIYVFSGKENEVEFLK